MKITKNNASGFTLIELLVVMAIIALLATMVIVSLSRVQEKSRDTRRIEDVTSIVKALEIYQTGRNRFPRPESGEIELTGTDLVSGALIKNGAIDSMPLDPLHPDYSYKYSTNELGTNFTIKFCLEGNSIPDYSKGCNNSITP